MVVLLLLPCFVVVVSFVITRADFPWWCEKIAPIIAHMECPTSCVVVHCRTGQIRSASLIASILVLKGGLSLVEAERVVSTHRHVKGGVIPQLRAFDKFDWLRGL